MSIQQEHDRIIKVAQISHEHFRQFDPEYIRRLGDRQHDMARENATLEELVDGIQGALIDYGILSPTYNGKPRNPSGCQIGVFDEISTVASPLPHQLSALSIRSSKSNDSPVSLLTFSDHSPAIASTPSDSASDSSDDDASVKTTPTVLNTNRRGRTTYQDLDAEALGHRSSVADSSSSTSSDSESLASSVNSSLTGEIMFTPPPFAVSIEYGSNCDDDYGDDDSSSTQLNGDDGSSTPRSVQCIEGPKETQSSTSPASSEWEITNSRSPDPSLPHPSGDVFDFFLDDEPPLPTLRTSIPDKRRAPRVEVWRRAKKKCTVSNRRVDPHGTVSRHPAS
jgi:hypothetical protein